MFLEWETQYHKNVNSPQIDLYIQCSSCQNLNRIFNGTWQKDSNMYMEK